MWSTVAILSIFSATHLSANKLGDEFRVYSVRDANVTIFAYDDHTVCNVRVRDGQVLDVALIQPWTFEASYPRMFVFDSALPKLVFDACFMHSDGYSYVWAHDEHHTLVVRGYQSYNYRTPSIYAYEAAAYDNVDESAYLITGRDVRQFSFAELVNAWSAAAADNETAQLEPRQTFKLPSHYHDMALAGSEVKVVGGQLLYRTNVGVFARRNDGTWEMLRSDIFARNEQFIAFPKTRESNVRLSAVLSHVPPIFMYCLELAVLLFFVYCLRYKLTMKPAGGATGTYELSPPQQTGVISFPKIVHSSVV